MKKNIRYRFLRFPNGKAKAVTFSYDDGIPADIRLANTLTEYGLKGTFNLNNTSLRPHGLTDQQIEEHILSKGHEIAIHGANHRAEGNIRAVEGIRDVLENRIELEERFGRIIRGMAYPDTGIRQTPSGVTYEQIRQYLIDLDIAYARTLGSDNNTFALPHDWYSWMPTAHHTNPMLLGWIDEFVTLDLAPATYGARRQPRLLYIWGHSYEFDNDNNWDLLDEICKGISGKNDCWYATNIEICEYVNAYHSLVYSVTGNMIHNPTTIHIWVDVDGILYDIKPGEIIKL